MSTAVAREQEPSDSKNLVQDAERLTADALGRLMEFWGFKRHMGRIWAVLYLSPRPLTTTELADVLLLSASAVSQSLSELLRWGAVRKCWEPGDRKDFYEAETSVWKLLRRVFERRELIWVREAAETFEQAERAIAVARSSASETDQARLLHMQRRLSHLRSLSRIGERLVRTLVSGRLINPAEIREVEVEEQP